MSTDKGSTQKPSPGALRAAEMITGIFDDSIMENELPDTIEKLAIIIDHTTAAPELLAALEGILFIVGNVKHETETGPRDALCRGGMLDTIRELAQGPVAKAKGELQ